jgi:8-oxo-dGTP pyrophosphatase MutT (NUDIX family)
MDFTQFLTSLSAALKAGLPGEHAHTELEPVSRKKYPAAPDLSTAIPGAVLALFYLARNNKIMLVFIQRQIYDGVHSGQISFPGGRYEIKDEDLQQTALRETEEEIGVDAGLVTPIGKLSQLYIPPSNFLVSPFVGYLEQTPDFKKDNIEVAEVFALDIAKLLDVRSFQIQRVKGRSFDFDAPCFYVDNRMIWGATAMMLNELITIVRTSYESD